MKFYFKCINAKKIIFFFLITFILLSIALYFVFSKNIFNFKEENDILSLNTNHKKELYNKSNQEYIQADAIQNNKPQTEFQKMLKELSDIASSYSTDNNILLCLQFIRRNKYNSNSWNMVAGPIDFNFVNYIKNNNEQLYNYNFDKKIFPDSNSDSSVDFVHLCATLNSYLLLGSTSTISSFSGWAGDLITLMEQIIAYNNDVNNNTSKSEKELIEYANSLLATKDSSKKSSFGYSDMLADIDAFNISISFEQNTNITLYDLIYNYYWNNNDIILKRESFFKSNLGNKESIEAIVKKTLSGPINSRIVKQIMSEKSYSGYYGNETFYNNIIASVFNKYFEKF